MKKLFSKEEYLNLEKPVRKHYNKYILGIPFLYLLIIPFLLRRNYQTSCIIALCITLYYFYILSEIRLFFQGRIKKLNGICVDIESQKLSLRVGFRERWTFYGKCIIYIKSDEKFYAVYSMHNSFKKGQMISVWYDGNIYQKYSDIYLLPNPYVISLTSLADVGKDDKNMDE